VNQEPPPLRIARLLGSSDAFILEAEIERLALRLAKVYPQLPPEAQADVILIGHSLSSLRRKIKLLQKKHSEKKGSSFPELKPKIAA
jgi:hypothetical protein